MDQGERWARRPDHGARSPHTKRCDMIRRFIRFTRNPTPRRTLPKRTWESDSKIRWIEGRCDASSNARMAAWASASRADAAKPSLFKPSIREENESRAKAHKPTWNSTAANSAWRAIFAGSKGIAW